MVEFILKLLQKKYKNELDNHFMPTYLYDMYHAIRPHKVFILHSMCDRSFCICIHAHSVSCLAKTSPYIILHTLQINVAISSSFRAFLTNLTVLLLFGVFLSNRGETKIPLRRRHLIPQTALRFGRLDGVRATHYENTPIQIYIENFASKNWKILD